MSFLPSFRSKNRKTLPQRHRSPIIIPDNNGSRLKFKFLKASFLFSIALCAYSYTCINTKVLPTVTPTAPPTRRTNTHNIAAALDDTDDDTLPNISAFGYELFSRLSKTTDEPNILLSPFSIASALALVLAGATPDSTCQSQIQSVLSVSSHTQIPSLSRQIQRCSPGGGAVQLTSANGLWIAKSIVKSYIETAQYVHGAKVSPLPDTFDPIDAYITAKTDGMIKNMLEGPIDPSTRAVLVNAVYFKGAWKTKFDLHKTEEGTFKSNSGGGPRKAMFMKDTRKMKIAIGVKELGHASIISLEYGKEDTNENSSSSGHGESSSDFCALFLLPPENTSESLSNVFTSLAALAKKNLSSTSFLRDIFEKQMHYNRVRLLLPRFRISYGTKSLKPQLKSMGIHSAFDGKEAFLQMSDDPQVLLDDVLHKAVMEVTEEGTVAAAATVVMMKSRGMPPPPIDMTFNRSFGMVVLHTPSMTPLFVARVNDPEFI